MSESTTTTDHREIQTWIETRKGRPSWVKASADGDSGILRVDFGEREPDLEPIDWDRFFRVFDGNDLAFLYQEKTADGKVSRFHKFVSRH